MAEKDGWSTIKMHDRYNVPNVYPLYDTSEGRTFHAMAYREFTGMSLYPVLLSFSVVVQSASAHFIVPPFVAIS